MLDLLLVFILIIFILFLFLLLFVLVFHFFILFFFIFLRKSNRKEHLDAAVVFCIPFIQQFLFPFLSFTLFYQVITIIYDVYTNASTLAVIPFMLCIINFTLFILTIYTSSIFLDSCLFSFGNALDLFDSRYNMLIYLSRFLFFTMTAFSHLDSPGIFEILIPIIQIIVFVAIFHGIEQSLYAKFVAFLL